MAVKKPEFDIKNVLYAAGGGLAVGALMKAADQIAFVDKNPWIKPLIPSLSGTAIIYFLPEYKAAGYGMLGVAGKQLFDEGANLIGKSSTGEDGGGESDKEMGDYDDDDEEEELEIIEKMRDAATRSGLSGDYTDFEELDGDAMSDED